jgi:hypothetical protein
LLHRPLAQLPVDGQLQGRLLSAYKISQAFLALQTEQRGLLYLAQGYLIRFPA